ncbi:hypothetical protein NP233_g3088 [Leucocoprinus birnbaumii]|uniref:Uncharacterized protein n=1 Tax=Leucocoprinus birnbaumii TaxID=56174 RepID=A0AAD5VXP9_9AGAR|nr:hypothetical protein NP233_g3088 [Leucocoprinus birnbaumii]
MMLGKVFYTSLLRWPFLLKADDRVVGWSLLMGTLEGMIEMSNVVIVTMNWNLINFESGKTQEEILKERLGKEVKKGLSFGRLMGMEQAEALYVIQGVIDLVTAGDGIKDRSKWLNGSINEARTKARQNDFQERWIVQYARIAEEKEKERKEEEKKRKEVNAKRKKVEEDTRVVSMQQEIDELFDELAKTEYGRGLCKKLRKAYEEQREAIEPLLAQLSSRDEILTKEDRERVERMIEDEYMLSLREFRGHFAEVRAMRTIRIGIHLREFYGLLEPQQQQVWRDPYAESATRVAKMMRKDDIVILYASLFQLLTGAPPSHTWQLEFQAQRVMHPATGTQTLLVSAPDLHPHRPTMPGLKQIFTHMDDVGVRFNSHIFVYSIDAAGQSLESWVSLKIKLGDMGGKVRMNSLIFLTVGWEVAGMVRGTENEQALRRSIPARDWQKLGFGFARLMRMSSAEAWDVLEKVMDFRLNIKTVDWTASQSWNTWRSQVEGQLRWTVEKTRVNLIQGDLDRLFVELEKTSYGRSLRKSLQGVSHRQTSTMEPLLDALQVDGITDDEKKELEEKIEEEYELFRREFRGYFGEIREMGVPIGRFLREFYRLRPAIAHYGPDCVQSTAMVFMSPIDY